MTPTTTTLAVRSRPIIFSAPMVRALLKGKTQTRRVVKPQPEPWKGHPGEVGGAVSDWKIDAHGEGFWMMCATVPSYRIGKCPYGSPGDQLWVRETHYIGGGKRVRYKASPEVIKTENGFDMAIAHPPEKWRSSTHMPHWASRFTLEITEIRIERLHDISHEDAVAEGFDGRYMSLSGGKTVFGNKYGLSTVAQFRRLWETINGKSHPWSSNPFVWVVGFRLISPEAQ